MLDKVASGNGRLLPIWHKPTKDELSKHAPSLGQVLALNTSTMSADDIVKELKNIRDAYRTSAEAGGEDDERS
ncbi:hypothetical protein [Methylobacterium sp. R2-1]|uniref:hypothetical protein n=1 Tax=Methylobacterium sp. R2-1 TaxID=2587064 RepID=UPI00160F023F|nr:hypothetical protein [Methylobacterium sp. R2-1]